MLDFISSLRNTRNSALEMPKIPSQPPFSHNRAEKDFFPLLVPSLEEEAVHSHPMEVSARVWL